VAERRRRGTNPPDDRRDEELSAEELDDELLEELDDEFDDSVDADDEDGEDEDDDENASRNGRRTATKPKPGTPDKKKSKTKELSSPGIFARLINFVREVVAELRKVIWPTRKELITYTVVVVVFVTIMVAVVGGLDIGLAKVALWVFGNKPTPAPGE
jgi:preprotein translocase subunit SecE